MEDIIATSKIICPICGHVEVETIPSDRCLFFYECGGCGMVLKPRPGDCCVFCSYGDRRCLSVQSGDSLQ